MKTKKYILRSLSTCLIAASLSACVDLEPRAMSFLTPENTFVDKAGLETMLRLCRKQMNFEWFGDAFNSGNCETYSVYEYAWSDLAVMGGPETKEIHNMVTQLTPTTNMYLHLRYWVFGWNGGESDRNHPGTSGRYRHNTLLPDGCNDHRGNR